MVTCAVCGYAAGVEFRFCPECGARAGPVVRERRKVVTLVFCDVVGYTALGEELDPEALGELQGRYFDRMRSAVEGHGGTVDKFIGDAVMAVFGLPVLHEDDALRALRAAVEMRAALSVLGLEGRIGVNSGEVVTGTTDRLATGDPVNVAARLQQSARPGEILLGETTLRLAGDAVEVTPLEPFVLKGKRERVSAWRLLSVSTPSDRPRDRPLVGRAQELQTLREAWKHVQGVPRCELVTVVGPAGVGKSRLVAEFVDQAGADVVRGRCLSYGEGITYWPVVEVVKQLGSRRARLELDADAQAALAGLIEGDGTSSTDEIARAFRKLLEAVASEGPLVAVFDDIQWGEEVFLDLLEHVALLSTESPILLLCMGRPELFGRRSGWGGAVRLQPLPDEASEELLASCIEGRDLPGDVRKRILTAAGGNPLFVEELAAMVESDGYAVEIPPTIKALLASRLDQLEAPERLVLECGSVEGELFHGGAVQALANDQTGVTARLTALVRKEFVRPERAQLPGEDGFRFRHLLIRDAAYEGLPKAQRAVLHERFADWLTLHGGELVELDELLGYHLEQAHRYLLQLGPSDAHSRSVGERAAERLADGGERALSRYDVSAAANLLSRALELLPTGHPRHAKLWLGLSESLIQLGDLDRAEAILSEFLQGLEGVDERTEWIARVLSAALEIQRSVAPVAARSETLAVAAVDALTALHDDAGIARAWRLATDARNVVGDNGGSEQAAWNALRHARLAGDIRLATEMFHWLGRAAFYGPTPVAEVLQSWDALEAAASTPLQRAQASLWTGAVKSLAGDDDAHLEVATGRAVLAEYGLRVLHGGTSIAHATLHELAGDWAEAEAILRPAAQQLEDVGEVGYRATVLAKLALVLCAQERDDEAAAVAARSAAITAPDDVLIVYIHATRALLAAREGRNDLTAQEARQAVRLTEFLRGTITRGQVFYVLAQAHQLAGEPHRAREAASEALAAYESKGAVSGARQTVELIVELKARATNTERR